ncbi:hypothetical protein AHAS_Ahas10G0102100 [Arachis hypogaea]
MKKIHEKLKGYGCYEEIHVAISEVIHQSLIIKEFENNWTGFVNAYCLEDNKWLQGLWNDHRCRVPVYLKVDFWAGISSTQRSESIHFLFDKYLNSQTMLAKFVNHYNNAFMSRMEKEATKNFDSLNKVVPCCSNSEIEVQFQSEYTNDIFKNSKRIFRRHSIITSCYMVNHRQLHMKHYDHLQDHFSKVVEVVIHSEQCNDLLHNLLKEFHCRRVEIDANLRIRSPMKVNGRALPSKNRKISTFERESSKCKKRSLKTHVDSNFDNQGHNNHGRAQGEFDALYNNVVVESSMEVIANQADENITITVCYDTSISIIV